MTAWPEQRRSGLMAAVATRAEAWLLEPPASRLMPAEGSAPPRPVVAVVGLGRRCGATTLARALAAQLAARDRDGAAAVAGARPVAPGGGAALATAHARRLARAVAALGCEAPRAVGRLALIASDDPLLRELADRRPAPLVLDVSHGVAPEPALALADRAVLVASPEVEPALAEVAAAALARASAPPLVVLNRCVEAEAWGGVPDVVIGESRVGARLAAAGREPIGPVGAAAAALADACAEAIRDA